MKSPRKKVYELELDMDFDSAHFLPGYNGKCANQHGHCWRIIINMYTSTLDQQHMVMDFKKIKDEINKLDHQMLNNFIPMPTAENIAGYLFDQIENLIPEHMDTYLAYVKVFESKGASVTVRK